MGQDNSHEQMDPNASPFTLPKRSLGALADYLRDENSRPKRVVVMTGAGISTSAGIPDFRSPDTGLYANLARLELPYPEAVFDISFFRQNPKPFYVLAKELYPGKFYPTVAHAFIALLEEKNMLQMLFTQNIDCLERRAGVPDEKIVEAHGSFATQRCIECKKEFPGDLMKQAVETGDVAHCLELDCGGLVKPDIVFFGEQLPESFFKNRHVPAMADVVIVMGTSLSVAPFSTLPQLARPGAPRLLFNKEYVGDLGNRPDDVVVLGDCDSGVRKLADALGWRDELEALWQEVGRKPKLEEAERLQEQEPKLSKDEILEAEINKLAGEVDEALNLSHEHLDRVNAQLDKDSNTAQNSSTPPLTGSVDSTLKDINPQASPATLSYNENIPINTENDVTSLPSKLPAVDTNRTLEATLTQDQPSEEPLGTKKDSHI